MEVDDGTRHCDPQRDGFGASISTPRLTPFSLLSLPPGNLSSEGIKSCLSLPPRSQVNRELAEKFAKSGINFSLLFSDLEKKGVKGANPEVIAKLFQQVILSR